MHVFSRRMWLWMKLQKLTHTWVIELALITWGESAVRPWMHVAFGSQIDPSESLTYSLKVSATISTEPDEDSSLILKLCRYLHNSTEFSTCLEIKWAKHYTVCREIMVCNGFSFWNGEIIKRIGVMIVFWVFCVRVLVMTWSVNTNLNFRGYPISFSGFWCVRRLFGPITNIVRSFVRVWEEGEEVGFIRLHWRTARARNWPIVTSVTAIREQTAQK